MNAVKHFIFYKKVVTKVPSVFPGIEPTTSVSYEPRFPKLEAKKKKKKNYKRFLELSKKASQGESELSIEERLKVMEGLGLPDPIENVETTDNSMMLDEFPLSKVSEETMVKVIQMIKEDLANQ